MTTATGPREHMKRVLPEIHENLRTLVERYPHLATDSTDTTAFAAYSAAEAALGRLDDALEILEGRQLSEDNPAPFEYDFEEAPDPSAPPRPSPFGILNLSPIIKSLGFQPRTGDKANDPKSLPPAVQEFSAGANGERPAGAVVQMAARVVQAALAHTTDPHITFDEDSGDLDFHMRLPGGLLTMVSLFPDGTIDASVYEDSQGTPVRVIRRMKRKTATERELLDLFQNPPNTKMTTNAIRG